MRSGVKRSASPWPDPAADALVGAYVAWREASQELAAAHRQWANSDRADSGLAAAGYLAALDREQKAASVYEHLVNQADGS